MGVLLEIGAEPVGDAEELFFSVGLAGTVPQVAVSQTVLSDGDRVILQTDMTVIVELGNAVRVVGSLIIRLFGEEHVVLAELTRARVMIFRGFFVPESEVTIAAEYIGTQDTTVIAERGQGRTIESSSRTTLDGVAARCRDDSRRDADATVLYYVTA